MSLRINGVDQLATSPLSPGGRLIDPTELVGGTAPAAPHALGGARHTTSTLAAINSKIAPEQIDATTAPRTPTGVAGGGLGGFFPNPTAENLTVPLRNESGLTIAKGKLLFAAGFSGGRITVDLADKDDPAKRPAIAVTTAAISNNADFDGLVSGLLIDVDTSSFSLTDQLVLGDDGNFSRPPPDQDPFTGEVQNVGSTVRISATVGIIQVGVSQGLQAMTADEGFGITSVLGRGKESGGAMSRATGRDLDVALGIGFVTDGVEYRRVTWDADTITLPANQTSFVFVDSAGTVSSSTSLPNLDINVILGSAKTDAASIVFISEHTVALSRRNAGVHLLIQEIVGPTAVSGGRATINGTDALRLDVDAAVFYITENRRTATTTAPITFTYWFRDGSGGHSFATSQTIVDVNNFDDGSGTLAATTAGKFKKDGLYIAINDGAVEFHLIYGQELFDSQSEAEAGNMPAPADDLRQFALRASGIVILEGAAAITSIVDERPFIGQLSTGTTPTSDHGQQSGLGDDDHPQYQLRSEENAANGYAGLDASVKLAGAQQVYGTGANTATQGNDVRLSDDRTADGIRTATTVVSVSGAAKPMVGQVLKAVSDVLATWQAEAGAGAQLASFDSNQATFPAASPAAAASRNEHPLLAFDDTTAENVIFHGVMSNDYAGSNLTLDLDWVAASATSGDVVWGIEVERIAAAGHDIDADSFAAQVVGTSTTSATSGVVTRTSIALTNAQADAIAAGDAFRLRVQRVVGDAGDTMVGDAQALRIGIRQ